MFILFPYILSKLDISVSDSNSSITQYYYGVFLLSLIALLCLINIIGFMVTYIIINEKKNMKISFLGLIK